MTDTETRTGSEFERGLALIARSEDTGVHDAEIGPDWRLGGAVHGGYLLALGARALSLRLPEHPDPFSISAYYLSGARPGPATLHTEIIRRGRSISHGSVTLSQAHDGEQVERFRAMAACHRLDALSEESRFVAPPPEMPPPQDCPAMPRYLEQADLLDRLDFRLDPATSGWAVGQPSGRGVVRGWLRMADGHEPDPFLLLMAVDVLPPVTREFGVSGYVPTVELTAHIRARPAPGWLRVSHSTRNYSGGYVEEDAEIWDETGRLVAQSRQLARAPRVPAPHG
jgi:acyl-CoA thioesterase